MPARQIQQSIFAMRNRGAVSGEGGVTKSERREASRIPVILQAVLDFNSKDYRYSATRNISLEGAFVKLSPDSLRKRAKLDLAIRLPSGEKPGFHRFHAEIVRVENDGAGVKFVKLGTDSYAALLDYIFSRDRPKST
jgi:hypothetical protein